MSDRYTRLKATLAVLLLTASLLLISSCSLQEKLAPQAQQAQVDYDLLLNLPSEPIDYESRVKPLLERRCVVCHGCYDAPCQFLPRGDCPRCQQTEGV